MIADRTKRVVMLSPVNFLRNYAGFQYLADSVHEFGFDVQVFAHIPSSMMAEARRLPYSVHSCYDGILGQVPRLRHLAIRHKIRGALDRGCDAVILNSSGLNDYFDMGVSFKRRNPGKILIQYCPELGLGGDGGDRWEKHRVARVGNANVPNMIIDVDVDRARIRAERTRLKKSVDIIPNTLPLKEMPVAAPLGTLAKISGCSIPGDKRILIFTGTASKTTLLELQAIMSAVSDNVFLLWFAHGVTQSVSRARSVLQPMFGEDRVRISNAVPRSTLLSVLHEADAGLIAYSHRAVPTLNQKFAAPTKTYEYLAAGLPIVSYGNPSILNLVKRYDIGLCAEDDDPESLAHAIDELFARQDFPLLRQRAKSVFSEELCYEKCAKDVLDRIHKLIDESPR